MRIQAQGVVCDYKTLGFGYGLLASLDFWVIKLFNPTTVQANHMIMVLPFVEFINRFATFEVVATQDTSLLKLGQNPIYRGQTDVGVLQQQMAKHIFGGHVALRAALKNFENFQSGQRGFQTIVFQFIDLGHGQGYRGMQN